MITIDLHEGPTVSDPVIDFTDEETDVKTGTFCGVVGKPLVVTICPLGEGQCMWRHRETGHCRFTNKSVTVQEFSKRVGLPGIDGPTANVLRASLKYKLYQEFNV